jgi:hypothetical protein
VTESWLNDTVTNAMLDSMGAYTVFSYDRINNKQGGGICALIPKHYKTSLLTFSTAQQKLLDECQFCDVLHFNLFYQNTKIRFILVYRPPCSASAVSTSQATAV